MHKICFTIGLFHASTCFEHHVFIVRRSKLYYTASGIITPIDGRSVHGGDFSKVTPSPARAHDSPPARTSPQRLKVTHLRFPCQRRAPPMFKLSLILQ